MPYSDKEDQARASKRHYEKNKDKIKNRSKIFKRKKRIELRKFVRDYLLEHPCVDCGEDNPIVLDFDHLPEFEKFFCISDAVNRGTSLQGLIDEMAKCEVRCANCHRIITHDRRLETRCESLYYQE